MIKDIQNAFYVIALKAKLLIVILYLNTISFCNKMTDLKYHFKEQEVEGNNLW